MKKKLRKGDKCLNCRQTLDTKDNYCSVCGQENNNNNVNFGALFKDLFSNYFSLDSKFGRSLKPFFFQPGKLTQEFLDGKRVKYANPIRWYLVISLFHFYFFSLVSNLNDSEDDDNDLTFFSIDDDTVKTDTLKNYTDSVIAVSSSKNSEGWDPITNEEARIIQKMNKTDSFSLKEIYDSLEVDSKPFIDRLFTKQFIKINRAGNAAMLDYYLANIPMIVFFILPLYALILKLFYFRRGYYIKHLIHTLHIHSFVFFILGIGWIMRLLELIEWDNVVIWSFWIILIYIFISFKRIYKQSYIKTSLKLIGVGFIYSIVLFFSLIFGLLVTLASF